MELYFSDDRSLIIVELRLDKTNVLSTTLIPPDQFKMIRTIGSDYLSHLSGKEQNSTLAKNGLSNRAKSKERVGT